MNLREVTIGRSNNCDIILDARCMYASNMHGVIYYDGNQLMYKDTSTNGTLINNVSVNKRAIPIHRGDVIMIAGKYPLSWNQIDSFFPYSPNIHKGTLVAATSPVVQPTEQQQPNLSTWNWGAFFLPGIWGLFNGCWWLFLLQMIPVPIIINIVAGLKGNKWAWNNKQWNSVQNFESTQRTWFKAGLIVFIMNVIFYSLYFFSRKIIQ